MSVRAMLGRVQRLEQSRVSGWVRLIGPTEEFDAFVRDGVATAKLDPIDAPFVLACVRRWVTVAP